jgi:hypothetical protein
VKRLFPNYVEVEKEYYRRTKLFPIMHTIVIRRDVYKANPVGRAVALQGVQRGKAKAYELYNQTAALPAMVPWLTAQIEEAKREMGDDWWPYGLEPNRKVLDTFLRYHHEQGLSKAPPHARRAVRQRNPADLQALMLYRGMDRAALDAAYNNAAAVKDSAQIVADWEARSARLRAAHAQSMDLRYGKDERNRIDYFPARRDGPVLVFIHGGYWQNRSKESLFLRRRRARSPGDQRRAGRLHLAPQKRLDGIVAEIHAACGWLAESIRCSAATRSSSSSRAGRRAAISPRWR